MVMARFPRWSYSWDIRSSSKREAMRRYRRKLIKYLDRQISMAMANLTTLSGR
jgi:hypothetical protein